jgi:hypothetical protein
MASFTLTDAHIIVNGTVLSDHANEVEVSDDRDQVENSAFGSATNRSYTKGLGDASIRIRFFQDFAPSKTHAVLQPLIASATPVQVEVRATSASRSATNPAAVLASALLFSYQMLNGALGEMSMTEATFTNAGTAGMTYPTA